MLDYQKILNKLKEVSPEFENQKRINLQGIENAFANLIKFNDKSSQLKEKYLNNENRITWLTGLATDNLNNTTSVDLDKFDYTVCSTDGSNVDLDQNSLPVFLLNIGLVKFVYNQKSEAFLQNEPYLFYKENDIKVGKYGRKMNVTGTHIALKRDLLELKYLWQLMTKVKESNSIALYDGSLIRWNAESVEENYKNQFMIEYRNVLDQFKINDKILCSYISQPNAKDVINLLKIAICPVQSINCATCKNMPCDIFGDIKDRDLFKKVLPISARSIVFEGRSKILEEYYDNRIYFCYLNTGDEVVRLEFPKFVAMDRSKLDLIHKIVLDQIKKGNGYPVAISEAHEQAVVNARDRDLFFEFLDKGNFNMSKKNFSKKIKRA